MYEFLLDLLDYCTKYNIKFGELTKIEQNQVIYRVLKYVINHKISRKFRHFVQNLDLESVKYI